jgi:hypothetical protein
MPVELIIDIIVQTAVNGKVNKNFIKSSKRINNIYKENKNDIQVRSNIDYIKKIKQNTKLKKSDANFAVVNYVDFYKRNYAYFVGYFKTLEEANDFAFSKVSKNVRREIDSGHSDSTDVFFFGDEKIAKNSAIYGEKEYGFPYEKEIIGYHDKWEIFSVLKPFPGIENQWQEEAVHSVQYYPDAYFPSTTSFPIYEKETVLDRHVCNYVNMKTFEETPMPSIHCDSESDSDLDYPF